MVLFSSGKKLRLLTAVFVAAAIPAAVLAGPSSHRLVTQTNGSGGAATFLQTSAAGSALQGEVAGSANTGILLPFGVLGEYNASGQFGAGVLGISTTGYGIGAETFSNQAAIIGYGSSSVGATFEAAIPASSNSIVGYYADVENGSDAAIFNAAAGSALQANNTGELPAVRAVNGSGTASAEIYDGAAVEGQSSQGPGVLGISDSDPALAGEFLCDTDAAGSNGISGQICAGLYLLDDNDDGGYPLLVYNRKSSKFLLYSDTAGDLNVAGTVVSGASVSRNPGTDTLSYSPKETESTVEDFGTAELSAGGASVPLRPDFRSTINPAEAYMVFLTPHGDSNGLYVASAGPAGFVVRESRGGHATLAFDYRIVARPAGLPAKRLPQIADLRITGTPRATPGRATNANAGPPNIAEMIRAYRRPMPKPLAERDSASK